MSFSESLENLKGFDINELDFNNAGSWPGLVKLIVFVILFSALVFGGYWFLIKDLYVQFDVVASQEESLKQQYADKAEKVANLDAYRQQMQEMERTFGALLKQLPADTEVPGLLEDITNTGLGSGLEIESIQLKPETSQDFYVELPMDISVVGSYHDIASFVSGVASLPRIVTLHDFQIGGVTNSPGGPLKMNVAAKTYRYSDAADRKKAKQAKKKGGKKK